MAWPNSARATGYIVTAADWNEIAAALALWGGNSDADGNSLIDVGTIVCGNGDATATTTAGTIRGAARTGTNAAGPSVTIAGGNGTGTGGGGALIFQTSPTGTSGSTANTLTERMRVAADGRVGIGTSVTSVTEGASTYPARVRVADNTPVGDGYAYGLTVAKFTNDAFASGIALTKSRSTSIDGNTTVQNGDALGAIDFYGNDGTDYVYTAGIYGTVDGAVSANTVPSKLEFLAGTGGNVSMSLFANGGFVVGAPTGGSQGAGTINATAVYDDGVLLTCYVPELKNKGGDTAQIDVAAWDARVPDRVIPAKVDRVTGEVIEPERVEVRRHEPLRDFLANRADTIDPRSYAQRWKASGVLPGFPSPQEWADNGPLSIGQLLQKLWEHIELQAVHISTLCDEIDQIRK